MLVAGYVVAKCLVSKFPFHLILLLDKYMPVYYRNSHTVTLEESRLPRRSHVPAVPLL